MKTLDYVPKGLIEIKKYYGNPDVDGDFILDTWFVGDNLSIFWFPFPMHLSWKPDHLVRRFQAHVKVGLVIIDALKEIAAYKGEGYLEDNKLNYYGGCFNFRKMRGADKLSTHSYGIAIDINPHIAPFGRPGRQPDFIVKAFERRGFEWGGRWRYPDPMHFQACTGY